MVVGAQRNSGGLPSSPKEDDEGDTSPDQRAIHLTPFSQRHQAWRRAYLRFDSPQDPLQVNRQRADWRAVRCGTLQREILDGKRASVFVEGENFR